MLVNSICLFRFCLVAQWKVQNPQSTFCHCFNCLIYVGLQERWTKLLQFALKVHGTMRWRWNINSLQKQLLVNPWRTKELRKQKESIGYHKCYYTGWRRVQIIHIGLQAAELASIYTLVPWTYWSQTFTKQPLSTCREKVFLHGEWLQNCVLVCLIGEGIQYCSFNCRPFLE